MDRIREVTSTACPKPERPEFLFEMTKEAAQKNFEILCKYGCDLGTAIMAQNKSPIGYGSEFRPISSLEKVFSQHPCWNRMKSIMNEGSKWPMEPLANKDREIDLKDALKFGNHKGATAKPELLKNLVSKDIKHGYGLVLPLHEVPRIPGALMAPMNIQKQNTIDENGKIVEKDRLTHDQSFVWESGTSVNSRVEKENLLPCRFGQCLDRLVNWTVAARKKFPNQRIVATKSITSQLTDVAT